MGVKAEKVVVKVDCRLAATRRLNMSSKTGAINYQRCACILR